MMRSPFQCVHPMADGVTGSYITRYALWGCGNDCKSIGGPMKHQKEIYLAVQPGCPTGDASDITRPPVGCGNRCTDLGSR